MERALSGHVLLVAAKPKIGLYIRDALKKAGADVTLTDTLRAALVLVDHGALSAAILDHTLSDGESFQLRDRLTQRGVPFVVSTDHDAPDAVVASIAGLISN